MESGEKGILGNFQAKSILDSILGSSQVGFFRWNIVKNEFIVMEDISKKQFDNVNNLPYFIHQIVHKKDREIALQDIEHFLNNKEQYYQSTFRIEDANNNTLWVFCKGLMLDSSTLGAIISDIVTGLNHFVKHSILKVEKKSELSIKRERKLSSFFARCKCENVSISSYQ